MLFVSLLRLYKENPILQGHAAVTVLGLRAVYPDCTSDVNEGKLDESIFLCQDQNSG
jgi:hypothetical protein